MKYKFLVLLSILSIIFFVGCNPETIPEASQSKMTIDMEFSNNEIIVTAVLIPKPIEGEFSFMLSRDLIIDEISSAEGNLEWETERVTLVYRSQVQKITITTDSENAITVKYRGRPRGWFNYFNEDKIAVNFYSVWYPQEFSYPETATDEFIVNIAGLSDYMVVNGEYREADERWVYSVTDDNDINIIALKKEKHSLLSRNGINIYYCDESEAENATAVYDYCIDVLDYYNTVLYPENKKDSKSFSIVSFSEPGTQGGAYMRENLIILDGFADIGAEEEKLYAHELAHFWARGADTSTFEDWLNETAAEWSALLYLLYSDNQATFNYAISSHLYEYMDLPAIKTADLSRPEGVHSKGTVLYYKIYREYGLEMIKELLNLFNSLAVKETDNFLKEISLKISEEIGEVIRDGIENITPVNEMVISFPDPHFEAALREIINKPSGEITQGDVEWVVQLNLENRGIADLTGIEYFSSLLELYLSGNQLTALDISNNVMLLRLDVSSNQLSELNVSKNVALKWLGCFRNQLTELDVSKNIELTDLWCDVNQLTNLDVSNNPKLYLLYIADNLLTSLDVSKNINLRELYCYGNNFADKSAIDGLDESRLSSFFFEPPDRE